MLSKVQFQQFQIIQCTRVVVLYCFGHFSFTLAKNAHTLHAAHTHTHYYQSQGLLNHY